MPLETATYVSDLNVLYPGGGESVAQGDDHLRLIKSVLKNTLPGLVGPLLTKANGSLLIPVGTTAQRDVAPTVGAVRYNTTEGLFESYTGAGWTFIGPLLTAPTGSVLLPEGTTAQRDGTPALGSIRYNSDLGQFEGYTSHGWGQVGGGQMYGLAEVKAIAYNSQTIGENLTVLAGQNGLSAGPVTVNNGFAVTVENGSVWSIV